MTLLESLRRTFISNCGGVGGCGGSTHISTCGGGCGGYGYTTCGMYTTNINQSLNINHNGIHQRKR